MPGRSCLAQDEDLPLSNWGAPPYWNPAIQPRMEGESGGGMLARVQGMQAQTESLPSSPLPFVAIAPCRIVDTRVPTSDGFHQPNFADDEARTFNLPTSPDCPGLPATAGAYSLNVQFRPLSQLAYLTAYPTGITRPEVSTLSAGPAAWVQNAAIVPTGTSGQIDIYCQYAGRVIIDVNGYYGPQSVVTSLNTLTKDVTLTEGSNIAITPSGNTLTIAATGGPGGVLPTGASGQTLYNNGSAWVADSNLYNDGSKVGIGTTTPGYQLDLNGMMNMPATTATSGTPTAGVLFLGGSPFLHNYAGPGSDGGNTFVGHDAGNFTMGCSPDCGTYPNSGAYNTGIGFWSLASNTTGWANTAIGWYSLFSNTTGGDNTAVGGAALQYNTTGRWNTATGNGSLYLNTTGIRNTASGSTSLFWNTTGSRNTAIGYFSLGLNTTANRNTALGDHALFNQTYDNGGTSWDTENTAIGWSAMISNNPDSDSDGYRNTAVGSQSLYSNITGSYNIAVGYQAGYNLTTGSWNIDIGNQGVADEANTIRIGDSNQTHTFIAGIRGVTTVNPDAIPVVIDSAGQLGTVSSSIRFKQDVADMGDASSRLLELRPVTFHYKTQPGGPLQYGLIAEEVEQVMPELVVHDATGQVETVAYHELPAMLLNELQKQQATIRAQQAQIGSRDARIAELENRQTAQQALIDTQQSQIDKLRREVQILVEARSIPAHAEAVRP